MGRASRVVEIQSIQAKFKMEKPDHEERNGGTGLER